MTGHFSSCIQMDHFWCKLAKKNDKTRIMSASLTIRLVDDTFFYIYAKDEDCASYLRTKYPEAEYKVTTFVGLDIPY
jgi:hypothetical protein